MRRLREAVAFFIFIKNYILDLKYRLRFIIRKDDQERKERPS